MGLFTTQQEWKPLIETPTGNGDSFRNVQKFVMGAGSSRVEMNIKDGFFVGADTFATAPFSIDFAGNVIASSLTLTGGTIKAGQTAYNTGTGYWLGTVSGTPKFSIGNGTTKYMTWDGTDLSIRGTLNADDIVAGTITGRTVKAVGTAGVDVWMNSSNGRLEFYYGNNIKGYLETNATGDLIIDADNSVYLRADGAGDYIYLNSGADIYLTSNNLIMAQAGNWQINECDSFIVNFNDDNSGAGVYFNEDGGLAMSIDSGKNVWMADNCSAQSFTDRTPYYDGESAIRDIKKIRGERDLEGKMGVDHSSLPEFIRKRVTHKNKKGVTFTQDERDLGNTISLLLEAVKELDTRLDDLELKANHTEK